LIFIFHPTLVLFDVVQKQQTEISGRGSAPDFDKFLFIQSEIFTAPFGNVN
jgi:hypothetical protein